MKFIQRKDIHTVILFAIFFVTLAVVFSCGKVKEKEKEEPFVLLKEPVKKYGFPVDSFFIVN
jgi:hypothetical protein